MTFRQILLASAAGGALLSPVPALSGDDLMVAPHYKDFTDRRVSDSAAYTFVKYFTTKAMLPATQDPVIMPILEAVPTAVEVLQPVKDAARTFTELLQKPQKASDPIIYTHPNPASQDGVVTTFAARAPDDVLASSTGFEVGGQKVAFRYCIEVKGQVVSYGGVGYDGLPVAATSGSSIPRKVGKPMIDPTTGAVVVDAATGQPRTSFAFACKAVLAQPIKDYIASRSNGQKAASAGPKSGPGV